MLLGGMTVSIVVAVLAERFAYRPLRNAPRLAPLITALGVSIFLQEGVRLFYRDKVNSTATSALPFPRTFAIGEVRIPVGSGTVSLPYTGVLLVVASIVLALALQAYVSRSRMGRAMRATAQDPDTARLMGINPDRVIVATFVLGAALAGIGGVLYGIHLTNVNSDIGFQNGIFAFTAAVLGGIGSLRGAVVGAFCIGLIKNIFDIVPGLGGTAYDYVWIFVILIFVLVVRPQGFFGETERVRA
jgi:branched-chain amino acid transport system permease protein